jgi:hypothetical protein
MLISGELTSGTTVHIEAVEMDESSLDDCGVPLKKQKIHALNYRITNEPFEDDVEMMEE